MVLRRLLLVLHLSLPCCAFCGILPVEVSGMDYRDSEATELNYMVIVFNEIIA